MYQRRVAEELGGIHPTPWNHKLAIEFTKLRTKTTADRRGIYIVTGSRYRQPQAMSIKNLASPQDDHRGHMLPYGIDPSAGPQRLDSY